MDDQADTARNDILDAALRLAASKGWHDTTMADIAAEAKLSLAEIYRRFPNRIALLGGVMRRIDETVLEGDTEYDPDEAARDRLFDIMMRRYDALLPHRDALRAILRDLRFDPLGAAALKRHLDRSMAWMLEAVGISATGPRGLIRINGLACIHLAVLRDWMTDDSPDLSRTMASLDGRLRRVEQFTRSLRRDRTPRPGRPEPEPSVSG
jgi:AcrR family transcriptional regulator